MPPQPEKPKELVYVVIYLDPWEPWGGYEEVRAIISAPNMTKKQVNDYVENRFSSAYIRETYLYRCQPNVKEYYVIEGKETQLANAPPTWGGEKWSVEMAIQSSKSEADKFIKNESSNWYTFRKTKVNYIQL